MFKTKETDLIIWESCQPDYLTCKKTGRSIYKMAYMFTDRFGSEPIQDKDLIAHIRSFWNQLEAERIAEKKTKEQKEWDILMSLPKENDIERQKNERLYDAIQNEGEEGFNPYRIEF